VATVATFYFDYKEIAEGTEVVEKLTELTEKVEKAHEDLRKVIADNRPMINQFLAAYERWMRKIDDIRITGGNTREALGQDMTRYGVSRTAPVVWQALP
jgi:hypothetical protein